MSEHDKQEPEEETGSKKGLGNLRVIFAFMIPYKGLMAGALIALVIAAGSTLAIREEEDKKTRESHCERRRLA